MAAGHAVKFASGWQELELALMCETFNALPGDVLAQDAYTLRRTHSILIELKRIRQQRSNRGGK